MKTLYSLKNWQIAILFIVLVFLINFFCSCGPTDRQAQSEQKKVVKTTKRVRAKHWYISDNTDFSFVARGITIIEVDPLVRAGDTVLINDGSNSGLGENLQYYIVQP